MDKRKKINRVFNKKTKKERVLISIIYMVAIILAIVIIDLRNYFTKDEEPESSLVIEGNEFVNSGTGQTYYVSENGFSLEGTDVDNPMSLDIANNKIYNGNDKILFKCGDIFYGNISFNVNTIENDYLYIGSYGEGEKPIISGAEIVKDDVWVLDEEGIYKIDLSITDNFYGYQSTSKNIGFIADEHGNIYGNRKNDKNKMENEMDFYVEGNYLYLKCSKNPYEKYGNLKFATQKSLMAISSNTIVENLNFQYTGAHGILHKNTITNNVCIRNCIIQNIGGSVQIANSFTRYGNGIEFWNQAKNTLVENCIIRNVYDAGYTTQGSGVTSDLGFENNICRNNIFINCTYDVEMFCRNDSNNKEICNLLNQQVYNNMSINQGRGWGYEVRPNKYSAATFVLWNMQKNNTSVNINNNIYFNSRRLIYIYSNTISTSLFKNGVNSDNNKFYLDKDTYMINDEGAYEKIYMLEDYDIEKKSMFNVLSEEELESVNNKEILNSNNYEEIKAYYEFLDGAIFKEKVNLSSTLYGYKYEKDEKEVILVYTKGENEEQSLEHITYEATDLQGNKIENTNNTLTITNVPILIYNIETTYIYRNIATETEEKCINYQNSYLSQLSSSSSMKKVKEGLIELQTKLQEISIKEEKISAVEVEKLLEKTYEIGDVIITSYKKNEFTSTIENVANMLNDLKLICDGIESIYENSEGDRNSSIYSTEISKRIEEFESLEQYYQDLNISDIKSLKDKASEYDDKTYKDTLCAYYLLNWANILLQMYAENYLATNPVKIEYSYTEWTNKDVIATLMCVDNLNVINNTNGNVYTFKENGEFTFEYTRRGKEYKEIAKVDYIDKTPPTITGIKNEKIYLDKVTPIISDDNLKTVKLYKDSSLIETYKQNDTISEDGRYSIEAEDEAGNRTNIEFDISRTPATITYSKSQFTNKDVIATIESNYDIQLTNNSNSKQYTFTENGEFTFEYTIRGQAFTVNAWVDYIDKTPPIVTGVQNGKTYYSKVAVNIQEDNLESVIFTKNGEQIEFTNGMTLEEYAIYELIATDKAGNEIDYLFEIAEKVNDTYKMDDTYIKNIDGNTLFTTFKEKLALKEDFEILRGEEILQDTEVIATGDILKTSAGESYTLIVKGDLDSNGSVNIVDLLKLRKYVSTGAKVETIETIAADIDLDDKLNIIDILKLRKILAN